MKLKRNPSAFTLIELLVVISIIGILITIAVPNISSALNRAKMTETLANARSLQQATQMMTLDSQQSGEGIIWTTQVQSGGGDPQPVGLSTFLTALTQDGYVTQSDMRKLLSAPGKTPTMGSYSANTIAFNIYQVSESSPADQVFLTTANLKPPGQMNANASPYGNKGFVFFTKGGGGGIRTRSTDATSTNNFPQGTTGADGGGSTYSYNTLQ